MDSIKFITGIFIYTGISISVCNAESVRQYEQCLMQALINDNGDKKVSEIKKSCENFNSTYTDKSKQEFEHDKLIMAFKPNYILPYAYNSLGYGSALYRQQFTDTTLELDDAEVQFQISIKIPLSVNLFNKNIDVFAAYTNRSFWQLYNDKISAPFRETNHEPEIWLQNKSATALFGFNKSTKIIGLSHQSNGRGGLLSRSWNRVYAQYMLENNSLLVSLKAWLRIKEAEERDDNADITDFLGHSELHFKYKLTDHTLSLMSRNNLESNFTQGALEASWSFPFGAKNDVKGYIQAFSGYGESMISYNSRVNRIGIGITISDWM